MGLRAEKARLVTIQKHAITKNGQPVGHVKILNDLRNLETAKSQEESAGYKGSAGTGSDGGSSVNKTTLGSSRQNRLNQEAYYAYYNTSNVGATSAECTQRLFSQGSGGTAGGGGTNFAVAP